MTKNILLGSDFMFNEELGSRLKGVGHLVETFSNKADLFQKLSKHFDLVIIDLEKEELGGLDSLNFAIQKKYTVLALTQHRSTDLAKTALELGAKKVIFNSQASKSIETYVDELLDN
ncbi:MAG: response regulator [Candidatus Kariarchaeaceae archaeon]|jgi:DNA-binding NtrC family response regulator